MKGKSFSFYSKELFKGSLAITLSQLGAKLAGFLLLPLFTAYLTETDYGIISLFTLVVSMISLLINPGIVSAITRIYFEIEEEEKPKLFATGFAWFTVVPLMLLLLLCIIGPFLFKHLFNDFDFYPYGFLAMVVALFTSIGRFWNKLMSLQYNMQRVAVFSLGAVVLNLLASILLVAIFQFGAMGRILGIIIGALLLYIVSNIDFIKACGKKVFSTYFLPKIFQYGSRLSIAVWSYFILNLFDRYMIEVLADISQVGLYQVGYTLASTPLLVILGAKALWNNIIFDTLKRKDYDTTRELNTMFYAVISLITLGTLLFGKELALVMTNVKFHGVIPILPVITLGIYFMSLQIIPGGLLSFDKKFSTLSTISATATIVNIGLNYFLIPLYGIMGAAIATLLAYFTFFIIAFIITTFKEKKLYDFSLWIVLSMFLLSGFGYMVMVSGDEFTTGDLLIKLSLFFSCVVFLLIKFKDQYFLLRDKLKKK